MGSKVALMFTGILLSGLVLAFTTVDTVIGIPVLTTDSLTKMLRIALGIILIALLLGISIAVLIYLMKESRLKEQEEEEQ